MSRTLCLGFFIVHIHMYVSLLSSIFLYWEYCRLHFDKGLVVLHMSVLCLFQLLVQFI